MMFPGHHSRLGDALLPAIGASLFVLALGVLALALA